MKNLIIKPLKKDDIKPYIKLQQQAYPVGYEGSEEEVDRLTPIVLDLMEKEDLTYYGAYDSDKLVGAMIHIKFLMNFHGTMLRVDGIGSVAVSLLDKKKGIAKEMILYILELAKSEGAELFSLYPFSPAFYKRFGFGFGAPLYHYKIPPILFPNNGDRSLLTFEATPDEIESFYNSNVSFNHGNKIKSALDKRVLNRSKILAVKKENEIIGHLIYKQDKIKDGNFLDQTITVTEMVYKTPEALKAIFSFFHSQSDQVNCIDVYTFDINLYHILNDLMYYNDSQIMPYVAHKTAEMGVGIMWQALNPKFLLKLIFQQPSINCTFNIKMPNGSIDAYSIGEYSKETLVIDLNIQSFSSWVMGAISLNQLLSYGALKTNNPERLKLLDNLLKLDKPVCHAQF